MTTAAATTRRLYRRPDHGVLGGVAAGIAEHIGTRPRIVRLLFFFLAVTGGLGIALYGAYWIVVPVAPDAGRGRLPRWIEYVIAAAAVVGAVAAAASALPSQALFVPALLACLGGALIWRQATDPERDRLRSFSVSSLSAGGGDWQGRIRLAAGVALVAAGMISVLASADVTAVRDGLIAMVVTVVGLALVTGPWWMRMVSELSEERRARIRTQERADIAAHLHDSVLQTLALIQRNAGSPREVARLARGQERELRTMLYDTPAAGQFGEQVRAAGAEVEDDYAMSVEVVVVGDAPLDDGLRAVAAAAREALVNAAKHSGVTTVSLYAEVEPDEVAVYVKDRGMGFYLDTIADDRQGVRGSIIGRIERHGGTVRVTTAPGAGTEVEIRMPRATS
ncbi:MAG TPA: PspC domain-containing protein [Jatrophihabitans sp.]|uniref:ATP-binding protein n=1 Tax=Jatrophihabitans sp. TaxID=1932789 RepID=UPI002DF9161B|nr:PspC domain-containing protein [Jatrophihabitans sp.]